VVRVVGGVEERQQSFPHQPVGAVLVVLPAFVLHHRALIVQPLLGQGLQQEAHAVGFQPQGTLQVGGGQ